MSSVSFKRSCKQTERKEEEREEGEKLPLVPDRSQEKKRQTTM